MNLIKTTWKAIEIYPVETMLIFWIGVIIGALLIAYSNKCGKEKNRRID